MVTILIMIMSIGVVEIINVDPRWFVAFLIVGLLMYRNYLGLDSKVLGYVFMFKEKTRKKEIIDMILCMISLLYVYYQMGYLLNWTECITFPFIFIMMYYFVFKGNTENE